MSTFSISGHIVDVLHKTIFPGTITIKYGCIHSIEHQPGVLYNQYILPGFIDAHIHIESSMLPPSEFARLATVHGTVATVSDPHEIANVLGIAGVRFMLANTTQTPFKIAFGAPSCVPATPFETAGATLTAAEIHQLLVAKQGQALLPSVEVAPINNFATKPKQAADFCLPATGTTVRVIQVNYLH